MLRIRNDAFHQLGDDNLADMKVAGPRAGVHAAAGRRLHLRPRADAAALGQDDPIEHRLVVTDASARKGADSGRSPTTSRAR